MITRRVPGDRGDSGSTRQTGIQVQPRRGHVERRRGQVQETYRGEQTTRVKNKRGKTPVWSLEILTNNMR